MRTSQMGRRRDSILFGAAVAGLLAAGQAQAATISASPQSGTYNEGDTVTVTIDFNASGGATFTGGSGTMNWTGLPGNDTQSISTPGNSSSSGSSNHTVTLAQNGTATWNAVGEVEEYDLGNLSTQGFNISGSLTVNNLAPTFTAANLNGYDLNLSEIPEGSNVSMSASASDPGADVLNFTIRGIDAGNDGITSGTRSSNTVNSQFNDEGNYTVTFEVNDGDTTTSYDRYVSVTNQPPAFTSAPGNGLVDFNLSTLFSFSAEGTDPGIDDVLSFNWDFDNDTEFDDFTGDSGEFDFATLPGLSDGTYTASVRLDDGDGGSVVHYFEIQLVNVPIPEPAGAVLLAGAGLVAIGRRRRS